jgi:hypothetical protein
MKAGNLILAAALVSLGLAACSKGGTGGVGSHICTPFPEAANTGAPNTNVQGMATQGLGASVQAADPAAALDDCLHRWGYTLAVSSDRAQDVAQATVAACTPALTRWNQSGLATGAAAPQPEDGRPTAPSLLTGQPTNSIAEHFAYAQGRALFYVVQARAGKCPPPPAANVSSRR